MITAHTYEIICSAVEESKNDSYSPRTFVFAHNERLNIQTSNPQNTKHISKQMQQIKDFIDDHCKVLPAYGSSEQTSDFYELIKVLNEEDSAVVRLSDEKNAVLFSVDVRLLEYAKGVGISLSAPNDLLLYLCKNGHITINEYLICLGEQFCNNRLSQTTDKIFILSLLRYGAQSDIKIQKVLNTLHCKIKILSTNKAHLLKDNILNHVNKEFFIDNNTLQTINDYFACGIDKLEESMPNLKILYSTIKPTLTVDKSA